MSKNWLPGWCVLSFFVIFIFGISIFSPPLAFSQNTVKLNYANFFPPTHKNSICVEEWIKEVEKRTNGAVKINYYPANTLVPANQSFDAVLKGIADIAMSCFSYTRGRFPMMEVIDLPLGYRDGIQATKLINAYYKKFRPKELDNVKVMYLVAHGPGILHTKKPVNKLEDIRGMKIKTTGTTAAIVKALGATPVALTMPDTYDALRTGIVEGILAPVETLQGWKHGELVKATIQNFGSSYTIGTFVVMNKAKWNALPDNIKNIIEKINSEWEYKQGKTWNDIDMEAYEYIKKRGNQIIRLSKEEDARWAEKVHPLLQEYVKEKKAMGLPADEALKFCIDFLKKN
ncbi:MAG TPA: TRAP transporter substrate-binding protein [Syntrophorhabdaceae bacterium]|nr:TRAP transporter substrate-binding protein [Syntrophorhabdaceae bacterium]HOT41110.1 TRAP transporter substrate-binding protein [Syntrophorhabdaceae bacterium]HPC66187.1 TRAP transporter substrate-binding protein [Syntrophorhabdaceae bacterium]HQH42848.1 TRAP transporter substrate-binding protein [Syntrophorhabdaceae bacterium]HQK46530.1 TRAP transporter substrate-binding protein [Syntrophorhabdaceae bacterium]